MLFIKYLLVSPLMKVGGGLIGHFFISILGLVGSTFLMFWMDSDLVFDDFFV